MALTRGRGGSVFRIPPCIEQGTRFGFNLFFGGCRPVTLLKDIVEVVLLLGRIPSFCSLSGLFFLSEDVLGVLSVGDCFVVFLVDLLPIGLSADLSDGFAFFLCHHGVHPGAAI